MARQIVVDVVGDASKFNKTLDAASGKTKGFGSVVQGIGLGIGAKAFDLVTDAVGNFIGKLGDAAQAYRDDQVSQTNLKNALYNSIPGWQGSTDAIEAYAASRARLGFQDDDIRASVSQLVGITHSQGAALKLTALAQDLARAKGISLAQATDIVTKAQQGNGKALKSLGIDISGASDAAGLLDAIQQNVKGSAEAWALTSEGKVAASNVKQAEAWEKIGSVVDKITSAVLPIAAEAFTVIADIISNVATQLEPVITAIVDGLQPAFQAISEVLGSTVIPIFKTIIGVFSTVVGWIADKIPGAIKFLQPIIGTLGKVFGTVFAGIKVAVGIVWDIIKIFGDAAGKVFGAVGAAISTVGKIAGDIFNGIGNLVSRVWNAVANTIKGAINTVIGAINGIIRGINSFQIHIHLDTPVGKVGFDWNGLNLGYIPKLHSGGIVPGTPGADVLTVLQAGEEVIPRNKAGSRTVVINFNGPVYGDELDELARRLAYRLQTVGG